MRTRGPLAVLSPTWGELGLDGMRALRDQVAEPAPEPVGHHGARRSFELLDRALPASWSSRRQWSAPPHRFGFDRVLWIPVVCAPNSSVEPIDLKSNH
jgi:hypothetical protein